MHVNTYIGWPTTCKANIHPCNSEPHSFHELDLQNQKSFQKKKAMKIGRQPGGQKPLERSHQRSNEPTLPNLLSLSAFFQGLDLHLDGSGGERNRQSKKAGKRCLLGQKNNQKNNTNTLKIINFRAPNTFVRRYL